MNQSNLCLLLCHYVINQLPWRFIVKHICLKSELLNDVSNIAIIHFYDIFNDPLGIKYKTKDDTFFDNSNNIILQSYALLQLGIKQKECPANCIHRYAYKLTGECEGMYESN